MKNTEDNNYTLKDLKLFDIVTEDFLEMNYAGLSDQTIARELGISDTYVKQIKDEMQRNY
ncbi:hypothetical protein SAMN05660297_00437 [Natronincola peptidivorans]|uniref:Uncharacterized protein n=1 Tax=Natronincola peptidivorans TaxID=426128 RepID=A0A1H9YW83_9FIRM|nr:hypothetical protein [Natronincola peptidivorans]SES73383.1 hypothetical protein SAMN05660297_00437 [Natronincola peptidivorans]